MGKERDSAKRNRGVISVAKPARIMLTNQGEKPFFGGGVEFGEFIRLSFLFGDGAKKATCGVYQSGRLQDETNGKQKFHFAVEGKGQGDCERARKFYEQVGDGHETEWAGLVAFDQKRESNESEWDDKVPQDTMWDGKKKFCVCGGCEITDSHRDIEDGNGGRRYGMAVSLRLWPKEKAKEKIGEKDGSECQEPQSRKIFGISPVIEVCAQIPKGVDQVNRMVNTGNRQKRSVSFVSKRDKKGSGEHDSQQNEVPKADHDVKRFRGCWRCDGAVAQQVGMVEYPIKERAKSVKIYEGEQSVGDPYSCFCSLFHTRLLFAVVSFSL